MTKRKLSLTYFVAYFLIACAVLVVIAPCFCMVVSSLKTQKLMFEHKPVWVFTPSLNNYSEILIDKGYYRYIVNSSFVAIVTTLLALVIGIPVAYAFSRFRLIGKRELQFFVLFTCMAPPIGIVFPLYFLFDKLGWIGTRFALIIAHTGFNLGLVVLVMQNFIEDVPKELDEVAMLDGCGIFSVLTRIILPIVKPGLVATAILVFIFSWSEFLAALILTRGPTLTLPVVVPALITHTGTLWGQVTAIGTIGAIPIVIVVFFCLKHLVRGLTFGALK